MVVISGHRGEPFFSNNLWKARHCVLVCLFYAAHPPASCSVGQGLGCCVGVTPAIWCGAHFFRVKAVFRELNFNMMVLFICVCVWTRMGQIGLCSVRFSSCRARLFFCLSVAGSGSVARSHWVLPVSRVFTTTQWFESIRRLQCSSSVRILSFIKRSRAGTRLEPCNQSRSRSRSRNIQFSVCRCQCPVIHHIYGHIVSTLFPVIIPCDSYLIWADFFFHKRGDS